MSNMAVLSETESECVRVLSKGFSQKSAAEHLGIHIRTFEEHIRSARRKYKAQTTIHLIATVIWHHAGENMWNPTIETASES